MSKTAADPYFSVKHNGSRNLDRAVRFEELLKLSPHFKFILSIIVYFANWLSQIQLVK